jgi:DNA polymerase III subunit gamma/tau
MGIDTTYRPKIFDDVIGQEVSVTILRSSVLNKRFSSSYLFSGPSGVGKAQPLWSKILTPHGFKELGDVILGDPITGKDGKIYEIAAVFDHKDRDYYKVLFGDGTFTFCDIDHLWFVKQYKKTKNGNYYSIKEEVVSLKDLIDRKKSGMKIGIPLNDPVKFKNAEKLLIHPYLLGALLGDGSFKSSSIEFTSVEKDVLSKIKEYLPKDCVLKLKDKITFSIIKKVHNPSNNINKRNNLTSLCNHVKNYGLFNKFSWEKFIPEPYLYSSVENRLELLRGLFDTGGHVLSKTTIEYSTTSEHLAIQVSFVARSLGAKVKVLSRLGSYKKGGLKKATRMNYRVFVAMPDDYNPISSNKNRKKYGGHRQKNYKFIKDIVYQGKTDTRCIKTTAPDQLYITDDFCVTHNTTIGRIFAKAVLCSAPINGNPCGSCESCRLFEEEKNFNYTELDAASVGGKEDMVKLKDDAAFVSVGNKKIILLDEAHDISKQGQDALLKQVEQCPEHLIYLFCTTEPEKLKPTLKKRCTHFQLSRVTADLIFNRLKQVCEQEKLVFEENALRIIADCSNGHVRDSLKALEEASYLGSITVDTVAKISVDYTEQIFEILVNLGSNLPQSLEISKSITTYISVWDLYEQMILMVSDATKVLYGYEDFLPKRKELLIRLRDTHGFSLIEFLSYLMTREKFIDRIGLQSDIMLLHYKFCNGSFKPQVSEQKVPASVSTAISAAIPSQPTPEQAPSSSPSGTTAMTHAQLMALPTAERQVMLRKQRSSALHNPGLKKEESQKIANEWSLPKEERQGSDSSDVIGQELTPLEFSRLMVGGRGSGPT